jgi:hypothetical protein
VILQMKEMNKLRLCCVLALLGLFLACVVRFVEAISGIARPSSADTVLKGLIVGFGVVGGILTLHRLVDKGKLPWLRKH